MQKGRQKIIMNINCMEMNKKIERINKELATISSMEKKFPKGELLCRKNGNYFKWYWKNQKNTTYLPKKKKEFAEKLALKKYYIFRKQELESELVACKLYMKKMLVFEGKADRLLEHTEFKKLLEKYFVPMKEELDKWQNASYPKWNKHEETLTIKGTQNKMLRSKSEAIIDLILYKNKIPFRYEEKIMLEGISFHPDFVIRHPVTGEFYYWEHFGMMDEEDYINHACNKLRVYCKNGIVPSVNLIMTFETKSHPLSVEKVESIIHEYFEV